MYDNGVGGRHPGNYAQQDEPESIGTEGLANGKLLGLSQSCAAASSLALALPRAAPIAVRSQPHVLRSAADNEYHRNRQQDNKEAGEEYGVPPADLGNTQVQQEHNESSPASEGSHQSRQGQGSAADKPLVDDSHQGLAQSGSLAYRDDTSKQEHQPDTSSQPTEQNDGPGAELIHHPPYKGAAHTPFCPGQTKYHRHGSVA